MAKCEICNKNMLDADTCKKVPIIVNGKEYNPIPYGSEIKGVEPIERCHDCGIKPGGLHHPGCDMEVCPVCRGQMIICDCDKA